MRRERWRFGLVAVAPATAAVPESDDGRADTGLPMSMTDAGV